MVGGPWRAATLRPLCNNLDRVWRCQLGDDAIAELESCRPLLAGRRPRARLVQEAAGCMDRFTCPVCHRPLDGSKTPYGLEWTCPRGHGRAFTFAVLNHLVGHRHTGELMQPRVAAPGGQALPCPSCRQPTSSGFDTPEFSCLHVCRLCLVLWVDEPGYLRIASLPPLLQSAELPPDAKRELAMVRVRSRLREEFETARNEAATSPRTRRSRPCWSTSDSPTPMTPSG